MLWGLGVVTEVSGTPLQNQADREQNSPFSLRLLILAFQYEFNDD